MNKARVIQGKQDALESISKRISLAASLARFSHKSQTDNREIPKYQNTFRLLPFKAFHAFAVDKIVRDVMETKLLAITSYEPDQASKLCLEIAADVLKAVGKKDYDRCKVVVQVNIVQRSRQSIYAAFQCLWDVEHDNYSYHVLENNHVHAWCCVFGIYYD